MVTFAVTLSDLIEKGGAYAGLAAFFGLAVLSVLYFAQARELKRLREWAGRAPERSIENEQRVVAQADQRRAVPPQRKPAAAPVTAAAATATTKAPPAKPAVAASAAPPTAVASAAPTDATTESPAVPPTETPSEHEVVASKAAPAEEPATVAAPAGNGTGSGEIPALPPRATPTPPPRRSAPAPAPYRPDGPGRTLPPRSPLTSQLGDDSPSRNTVVLAGAAAGVVLLIVAIIFIVGGGGNDGNTTSTDTTPQVAQGTPSPAASTTATPARGGAGPARAQTKVQVLNGTFVTGLAATTSGEITQAGWADGGTGDYTDQARSATIVFYVTAAYRSQAQAVARLLDVTDVQLIDDATRGLVTDANVVVVVGNDQEG